MDKFNLIPAELTVTSNVNKLVNNLKKFSITIGSIALFAVVVMGGIFVYLKFQIDDVSKKSESLKQEIESLNQSEQKLIFAKDRLAKIGEVRTQKTALEELVNFNYLYDFLKGRQDMLVSEVSIDTDQLEISIISSSLYSVSSFFDYLDTKKDEFKSVEVSTFSYSPKAGYVLNLDIKSNET